MDDDSMGPGRDVAARWGRPGGHRSPRLTGGVPDHGSGGRTARPVVLVGSAVLVLGAVFVVLMALG